MSLKGLRSKVGGQENAPTKTRQRFWNNLKLPREWVILKPEAEKSI